MKRLIVVLLVVLSLALSACGSAGAPDTGPIPPKKRSDRESDAFQMILLEEEGSFLLRTDGLSERTHPSKQAHLM
jgi:hypothetical protein